MRPKQVAAEVIKTRRQFMKTEARRVAGFRRRLAQRAASWAIEIPATKRINLELTQEQQRLLRRATRHVFPSVDFIFYSDAIAPSGHALACLKFVQTGKTGKSRARKPGR
jgi:hypothetical protein